MCLTLYRHTLIPPLGYKIAGISGSSGPWVDGISLIIMHWSQALYCVGSVYAGRWDRWSLWSTCRANEFCFAGQLQLFYIVVCHGCHLSLLTGVWRPGGSTHYTWSSTDSHPNRVCFFCHIDGGYAGCLLWWRVFISHRCVELCKHCFIWRRRTHFHIV